MAKSRTRSDEISRKYTLILQNWLRRGGEAALHRAYEIGRTCLADGRSILDMVAIHHSAMRTIEETASPSRLGPEALKMAGQFFAESMSPYEMTHRAFSEGNRVLRRLNETLEEQNRHIASEIHDRAGQFLTAVHIELEAIVAALPADRRACFDRIKGLLDQAEKQLRELSHELRPAILDDLGLIAALEYLASRIEKRTGIRVSVRGFDGKRLPGKIEMTLYRIIQEALNNITKHAHATAAKIALKTNGKAVLCAISDNGIGFDPGSLRAADGCAGLGLLGIRERLQALQGELRIDSVSGEGTKLKIKVPLES